MQRKTRPERSNDIEEQLYTSTYERANGPVNLDAADLLHESLGENPLSTPLINTSHSIAYALTNSIIDPFSNLIRHLHESNDTDKDTFNTITTQITSGDQPSDFVPVLVNLLRSTNKVRQILSLQSLQVLSINDADFCREVLKRIDDLLNLKEEKLFIEVLQLLQVVAKYANENTAKKIIARCMEGFGSTIDQNIRNSIFSVYAVLSKHGNAFPPDVVELIRKNINFPGKPPLDEAAVWPCLDAIENFLSQSSSNAYKVLEKDSTRLLAKLAHAAIIAERDEDSSLIVYIFRVFLEVLDEFRLENVETPLEEFFLQLNSVLISMKMCGETEQKRVAETVLARLGVTNSTGHPWDS